MVIRDKFTSLCRNRLWQNNVKNKFCEMRTTSVEGLWFGVPLPSKEGTIYKVLRTSTSKPRPESGRDCLTCAIFARQRGVTFPPVGTCCPTTRLTTRPTRWTTTLSSKVNLHHAINFWALPWSRYTQLLLLLSDDEVDNILDVPHGVIRPFHQKSTCITQLTLGALRSANLVT